MPAAADQVTEFEVHIQTPPTPPYARIRETWQALDEAGYDALWTWDHFFTEWTAGDYEGWTLLAALAETTERARVGVLVTAATFRHPSVLAKSINTVDHISGGRLIIGLGMARLPSEHAAFGVDFPSGPARLRRLDETCHVIKGLATGEPFSFEGEVVRLRDARGLPAALQQPHPPILIGAHGPRMIDLTVRHADWWNGFGDARAHRALNQRVDAACEAAGRDPRSLRRLAAVAGADAVAGAAQRYRESGADGIVIIAGPDQPEQLAALRAAALA